MKAHPYFKRSLWLRIINRLYFGLRDRRLVVLLGGLMLIVFLPWRFAQIGVLRSIVASLLTLIILFVFREILIKLDRIAECAEDTKSSFALFSVLRPLYVLPPFSGFSIGPDAAGCLINLIKECCPKMVLELGGGVSSLVLGYTLKGCPCAKVISVDHDEHYATLTRCNIALHGLNEIVSVIYAPLKRIIVDKVAFSYYSLDAIEVLGLIDMLIIDGPPAHTHTARFPALPLFYERLSDNAIVFVDDYNRPGEKWCVQEWIKMFPDFELEEISTQQGTAILRRKR